MYHRVHFLPKARVLNCLGWIWLISCMSYSFSVPTSVAEKSSQGDLDLADFAPTTLLRSTSCSVEGVTMMTVWIWNLMDFDLLYQITNHSRVVFILSGEESNVENAIKVGDIRIFGPWAVGPFLFLLLSLYHPSQQKRKRYPSLCFLSKKLPYISFYFQMKTIRELIEDEVPKIDDITLCFLAIKCVLLHNKTYICLDQEPTRRVPGSEEGYLFWSFRSHPYSL